MKVLLQQIDNSLYLGRGGNWTASPELALAFLDETRAKDYGIYRRLSNVRVVVRPETVPDAAPVPAAADETHFYSESLDIAKENPNPLKRGAQMKTKRTKLTKEPLMAAQMAETVGEQPPRPIRKSPASRQADPTPLAPLTSVKARLDVGLGNALFIRGQGDGLSWDKGQPLACLDAETWAWTTTRATDEVVFKLLLNDRVWAKGDDLVVRAGQQMEVVPSF